MEWTGIAIFYFACLSFGFLFALVSVIFGELLGHADVDVGGGHDFDFGHDLDLGHDVDLGHDIDIGHGDLDMPGASVLNSLTVCTLLGFFGLIGLFAVWVLNMGPLMSLAVALPGSLLAAAAQFVFYVKVFVQAQGSSEATMSDILGCRAEVITGIPEGRIGEIAYVIKGTRYTAPATGSDGEAIPRGTSVHVVNVKGTTFVVRPL